MLLDNGMISSDPEQYGMKLTFAVRSIGHEGLLNFRIFESTELSFCCFTNYDFLAPKRAIHEDLVILF